MTQRGHAGLIIPVATSGATLGLALLQYPVLLGFTQPSKQSKTTLAGRPLSQFWETSLYTLPPLVLSLTLSSAAAGLLSFRWLRSHSTLETTNVASWYMYGSLFALGHALFIPFVGKEIQLQIENGKSVKTDVEIEQVNQKSMDTWFIWHTIRTLTVDLGAVICFSEAVAQSLWIV